ncbi:MarR family transcriptional regulator [Staphylococcus xylosus]|uniref:MarR family transcriptional regulator n=2 Tax=Staphylococcus xylosus TaxID=1288 RepID=A0AAQ0RXF3_STAXY|nr:MarR family transcriptional regulator [Staphylococcus xylosus]RIM92351.1 MarR family transcriptional regulator [Staphylococcus xylosus]
MNISYTIVNRLIIKRCSMNKENIIKSITQLIQIKENPQRNLSLDANQDNLSITQFHILAIILKEQNVNNRILKERLKISAPAITKATRKLIQLEYIIEDKKQDNKKIYYKLLDKGIAYANLHEHMHNQIINKYLSILEKYNDEELATIDSFIKDLTNELEG